MSASGEPRSSKPGERCAWSGRRRANALLGGWAVVGFVAGCLAVWFVLLLPSARSFLRGESRGTWRKRLADWFYLADSGFGLCVVPFAQGSANRREPISHQ